MVESSGTGTESRFDEVETIEVASHSNEAKPGKRGNWTSVLVRINNSKRANKFFHWLLLSVLVALLPIGCIAIVAWASGKPITAHHLLKDGELLMISAGVAAGAISDLFGNQKGTYPTAMSEFPLVMCVLIACFASVNFAIVAGLEEPLTTAQSYAVVRSSIWMFAAALVGGGCCIVLSR